MLTQERADILTNYLSADVNKTEALLGMEPADALAEINAAGYDFTVEELNAYAQALKFAKAGGELNTEELENVAGGFGLVAAGLCIVGGIVVGIAVNAKW